MAVSREAAAAELVRRGVIKPQELGQYGLGHLARQFEVGLEGPAYDGGPDKVATRGAWLDEKKRIATARERLGPAGQVLSQLDQFENLNTERATGRLEPVMNSVGSFFGVGDPKMGTMAGIKSRLQGMARPVGSGATSDFEQRLYAQGVPGPEKLGPENQNIIHHMRGTYAEENDRLAAEEAWLDRRRTLNGFQDAWTRYLKDQPYVSTEGGRVRTVGDRQSWQEYMGLVPAKPRAPRTQALPTRPAPDAGAGLYRARNGATVRERQ